MAGTVPDLHMQYAMWLAAVWLAAEQSFLFLFARTAMRSLLLVATGTVLWFNDLSRCVEAAAAARRWTDVLSRTKMTKRDVFRYKYLLENDYFSDYGDNHEPVPIDGQFTSTTAPTLHSTRMPSTPANRPTLIPNTAASPATPVTSTPATPTASPTDASDDFSIISCPQGYLAYEVRMYDRWGDGWGSTVLTITTLGESFDVLGVEEPVRLTLETGYKGDAIICLNKDKCHLVSTFGLSRWAAEIYWEIYVVDKENGAHVKVASGEDVGTPTAVERNGVGSYGHGGCTFGTSGAAMSGCVNTCRTKT